MANNMNVSLALQGGNNVLDVDDNGGQNIVGKGVGSATISWNLTGPIAQGSFLDPNGTPKGFEFVGNQPPPGTFGAPYRGSNGKSMNILDNNSVAGEWIYILRVNYNGNIVGTQKTLATGTIDNPVIINKGH